MPQSKKSTERPLELHEICGCGSEKPYKDCCSNKSFTWYVDDEGSHSKLIHPTDRLISAIDDLEERFVSLFGRKPKRSEPMYVDYFFDSPADYWRKFGEIGEKASIRPEVLFATILTEKILSEDNLDTASDLEIEEWDNAVDLYFELFEDHDDPYFFLRNNWPRDIQPVIEAIYASIVVIVNAVHSHGGSQNKDQSKFVRSYIVVRSQEIAKAVYRSIVERYSEESLALLRGIYEAALNLYYIQKHPEKSGYFVAQSGITRGTHEVTFSNVGKKRKIIRDLESGEEFPLSVSWHERISCSQDQELVELHTVIYAMFSSYAHSGIDPFFSMITQERELAIHRNENVWEAIQWLPIVQIWLLDAYLKFDDLTPTAKRDLRYARKRLSHAFKKMVLSGPNPVEYSPSFQRILRVIFRSV